MTRTPAVAAVIGLLSAGLYTEAVLHKAHHAHANISIAQHHPLSLSQSLSAEAPQENATQTTDNQKPTTDKNPFLVGILGEFMEKFNIPKNHGSGIFVDLSGDKEVDGVHYREVVGRCPVFGKNIKFFQPEENSLYKNDFLEDIPSGKAAEKAVHPLPGGFNNNGVLLSGARFSPMTKDQLFQYTTLKAHTPLGRCAEMSYATKVPNSDYRYPFVFDMDENRCYSLKVSSQRLWGERYCSVNGNPSNMTWYCYKPERDPHHRPNLVYGSAYVGEHPDDWEKNCPTKAVSDAVFGVWEKGECVDYKRRSDTRVESGKTKQDCWASAFNNSEVASDQAESPDEHKGGWGYYFPSVSPNQPKSGGKGRNYASYYPNSKECVLSKEVPTCFYPLKNAVSYTALGSLDEVPLPCSPETFSKLESSCDRQNCMATVTRCVDGKIITEEVDCLPEDGSKCESRGLLIGLSVAGGLALLALVAGSLYFYTKKPKPPPKTNEEGRSDYHQDLASGQRKPQRPSDFAQQAEPSFWEEADIEPDPEIEQSTDVLLDQEY